MFECTDVEDRLFKGMYAVSDRVHGFVLLTVAFVG